MQDIIFAQVIWLYAGIALAVALILAFRFLDSKNRRDLEQFASGQFLAGIRTGISQPRRLFKRSCYVLGVLLLFTALARPQIGFEWREVKRKGIDILFAIDSSRSMLAEDMSPNRLERVKLGMIDFVEKLDGDRIGLLPFSGSSFLLCPLTLDYHTFKTSLDAVDTEIIPHKGTDIASAIREADAIFEEAGNNHRILVVLTDGEDLQGEALAAAREAAENGMIIHTVGIGSPEGELIPIGGSYLQDASGNPVKTKLDETGLKAISEATEGTYVRFGQLGEGLQTIYQEKLALVPKEELKQRMQKVPVEQYQWPLGAAILLFLLDFIISDRRRPAKPSGSPLTKAALILAAGFLALPNSARAESAPETYNSGITAFADGEFDKAQQAFRDTLSNTSDLSLQARSYYNLGNTLFSIGAGELEETPKETIKNWEESLLSYENSLKLNPGDPDAKHNRDYVKKLLDELKKQEDQQEENEDEKQDESEDQESEEDSEKKGQENSESEEQDQEKQDQEQSDENKEGESEEDKEGDSEEHSGEDQQEGDEPGEEEKEDQGQSGEESDEEKEGEESQQSKEGEEGEESEEKEGKPGEKEGQEGEEKDANQAAGEQARSAPGEMSPEEAKELLKALKKDEKRVIIIPQKAGERRPQKNKTKGKDW